MAAISIKSFFRKIFSRQKEPITLEQYVELRRAKGDTNEQIRKDLLDDLERGGEIFGDFKKALQPTFPNSKSRYKSTGSVAEIGISTYGRWETESYPRRPACPKCLALHGQVKTWDEWEEMGFLREYHLPKHCNNGCYCYIAENELIPIEPTPRDLAKRYDPPKTNSDGKYLYKWTTEVQKYYPACKDCLELNGLSKTWEEWESTGVLVNGLVQCKNKKRCIIALVPD